MKSLILGTVFAILTLLLLYTFWLTNQNRQLLLDQQVYLEGLRTRVYILEGEMNMAKARARRFWTMVDKAKAKVQNHGQKR